MVPVAFPPSSSSSSSVVALPTRKLRFPEQQQQQQREQQAEDELWQQQQQQLHQRHNETAEESNSNIFDGTSDQPPRPDTGTGTVTTTTTDTADDDDDTDNSTGDTTGSACQLRVSNDPPGYTTNNNDDVDDDADNHIPRLTVCNTTAYMCTNDNNEEEQEIPSNNNNDNIVPLTIQFDYELHYNPEADLDKIVRYFEELSLEHLASAMGLRDSYAYCQASFSSTASASSTASSTQSDPDGTRHDRHRHLGPLAPPPLQERIHSRRRHRQLTTTSRNVQQQQQQQQITGISLLPRDRPDTRYPNCILTTDADGDAETTSSLDSSSVCLPFIGELTLYTQPTGLMSEQAQKVNDEGENTGDGTSTGTIGVVSASDAANLRRLVLQEIQRGMQQDLYVTKRNIFKIQFVGNRTALELGSSGGYYDQHQSATLAPQQEQGGQQDTTTATTTSEAGGGVPTSSSPSVGLVAAMAVIVLVLLTAILFVVRRRQKKSKHQKFGGDDHGDGNSDDDISDTESSIPRDWRGGGPRSVHESRDLEDDDVEGLRAPPGTLADRDSLALAPPKKPPGAPRMTSSYCSDTNSIASSSSGLQFALPPLPPPPEIITPPRTSFVDVGEPTYPHHHVRTLMSPSGGDLPLTPPSRFTPSNSSRKTHDLSILGLDTLGGTSSLPRHRSPSSAHSPSGTPPRASSVTKKNNRSAAGCRVFDPFTFAFSDNLTYGDNNNADADDNADGDCVSESSARRTLQMT